MQDLETLTVKQLQEKLVELGMPEDDVAAFRTKAPLIASIRTLEAKDAVADVPTAKATDEKEAKEIAEGKKVASIEERPNPAEDREVNRKHLEKATVMKKKLLQQPTISILIPLEPTEKAGVVQWAWNKAGKWKNINVKERLLTDAEWNALSLEDKMQTMQVHISGDIASTQLNGYKYFIAKGRYTPVPHQIAEVISKSQQQTLDAGSNISLDRIDPRTGKPYNEIL